MAKTVLTVLLVISGFLASAWNAGGLTNSALPSGYEMVLVSRGLANSALPTGYRMVLVSRGTARREDAKNCDNDCHIDGKWCPSGIFLCRTIDPSFGCIKDQFCDCYNTCSQG
jgi:hypothetical protein